MDEIDSGTLTINFFPHFDEREPIVVENFQYYSVQGTFLAIAMVDGSTICYNTAEIQNFKHIPKENN